MAYLGRINKTKLKILVVLFLVVTSAFLLRLNRIDNSPWGYDEADYAFAARQGFYANFTDQTAIPIGLFFRKGLEHLLSNNRASLSEYIRSTGDVSFYRHFHPPLFIYIKQIVSSFIQNDELSGRIIGPICGALLAGIVMLFAYSITKEGQRLVAATLSGIFVATEHFMIESASVFSAHAIFSLTATCSIIAIVYFLRSRSIKLFYATFLIMSLCFLSLVYSLIVFLTCCISLILNDTELRISAREISVSSRFICGVLLMLAGIVALWPGSIMKLSIFRSYIFLAYTAIFAPHIYFNFTGTTFMDAFISYAREAPITFFIGGISLTLLTVGLLKSWIGREFAPILIFPLLFIIVNIKNLTLRPYLVAHLVPFLGIGLGACYNHYTQNLSRRYVFAVTVLLCATILGSNTIFNNSVTSEDKEKLSIQKAIEYLNTNSKKGDRIFVLSPLDFPSLNYYLPDRKVVAGHQLGSKENIVKMLQSEKWQWIFVSNKYYKDIGLNSFLGSEIRVFDNYTIYSQCNTHKSDTS